MSSSEIPEEYRIKFKNRSKNSINDTNAIISTHIINTKTPPSSQPPQPPQQIQPTTINNNTNLQLKLNLVKKDKNSPLLSIQNFIYDQLREKHQVNIKKLWEKYEKNSVHSLLIERHELNYNIFREISEQILDTFEPYHIIISPASYPMNRNHEKIDLIYKTL